MSLFGGLSIINAPAAAAADSQIANADYSPGDLYASLIYSMSGDVESADGVELAFNKICTYPAEDDTTKTYGRLKAPSSAEYGSCENAVPVGGQLVSALRTYYDYGWFEPLPKAEDNILSWMFQVVIDWASDTIGSSSARAALGGALVGATMYDFSTSMLAFGEKIALGVNLPQLFGLVDAEGDSGIVSKIFSTVFSALGITGNGKAIKQLSIFTLSVITFVFILVLIKTIRSNQFKSSAHASNMKKFGSRILMMALTVPMAVMATSVINSVTAPTHQLNELAADVNSNYIVDTLDWAIYGNMSLNWVNPNGQLHTDGTASPDFAPTRENVDNLNRRIIEARVANGTASEHTSSAMGLLEEYADGQTATVQDYFAGIANLNSGALISRTARNLSDVATGYGDDTDKFSDSKSGATYFFAPKTKSKNAPPPAPTTGVPDGSYDPNTGTVKTPDKEASSGKTIISVGGTSFEIDDNSPVNARRVTIRDPQSYLYGAVPAENLSDATKKFVNYIYDSTRSEQLINPNNGQAISKDDKSPEAKAIRTNALKIAATNRYAGLREGSFSDQSTAFFLQTKRVGPDSINYKGYNTAANEAGESKNTGMYGNAFIRYVMPSNSVHDYYGRISSITSVWAMSGILGFVTLFALLRAPVFAAMLGSMRGFLSSLFMGNFIGFLEFLLWFTALRLSFAFATVGIHLGVGLNKYFIADNSIIYNITAGLFGNAGVVGGVPLVGTAVGAGMAMMALLPLLLLSMLLTAIVCIPAFKVQFANGNIRKVSVIGAIVMLPYLIAESLAEQLNALSTRIYGKQRSAGGMGKGLIGGKIGQNITKKAKAETNKAEIDKKRAALETKRQASSKWKTARENELRIQDHQNKLEDKRKASKSYVKAREAEQDLHASDATMQDKRKSSKSNIKAEKNEQKLKARETEMQDKRRASRDFKKSEENAQNLRDRDSKLKDKQGASDEFVKATENAQDIKNRDDKLRDKRQSKQEFVDGAANKQDQQHAEAVNGDKRAANMAAGAAVAAAGVAGVKLAKNNDETEGKITYQAHEHLDAEKDQPMSRRQRRAIADEKLAAEREGREPRPVDKDGHIIGSDKRVSDEEFVQALKDTLIRQDTTGKPVNIPVIDQDTRTDNKSDHQIENVTLNRAEHVDHVDQVNDRGVEVPATNVHVETPETRADAPTTKVDATEVKVPESRIADTSNVETPEVIVNTTDRDNERRVPRFELPDMPTTEVKMPEVKTPESRAADTSNVEIPEVKIPEMNMPGVEIPEMNTPNVEIPEVKLPEMNTPNVEIPEVKLPEIKMPEVEIPEMNTPNVEIPEVKLSEVNTPGVEIPEVKIPEMNMPEVKLPEVNVPEVKLPEVNVPNVEMPEVKLPEVNVPNVEIPEVNVPEVKMPEVKMPEVKMPEVKIPEMNMPEVKLPEVNVPNVEMPEVKLPEVNVPNVEIPEVNVPEVKMPEVKMPEVKMPEVKIPEMNMPEVKLPEVKLPEVKIPEVKLSDMPVNRETIRENTVKEVHIPASQPERPETERVIEKETVIREQAPVENVITRETIVNNYTTNNTETHYNETVQNSNVDNSARISSDSLNSERQSTQHVRETNTGNEYSTSIDPGSWSRIRKQ